MSLNPPAPSDLTPSGESAPAIDPASPVLDSLPELADRWRSTLGWCPSPSQQQQFIAIYQAIVEANQFLNLTRLTTPADFWEKHLWDSLSGLSFFLANTTETSTDPGTTPPDPLPQPQRIIDIGTGGGFPGLPAAVLWPESTVTLLDSTRKKIAFLEGLIERLNFATVTALVGRAEAVGQEDGQRESYDLALVRAVGGVTICAEYALPLVRRGGYAVLYRGQWSEAEEESLRSAALDLGGVIAAVKPFTTPLTGAMRHCILLKKEADTPEAYPRSIGVPSQKPLGLP
ncbi:MAG: 16S rRNA (guanine(527)-N(7))-methyltransferase RsmG [Prochlorothrix sp.]